MQTLLIVAAFIGLTLAIGWSLRRRAAASTKPERKELNESGQRLNYPESCGVLKTIGLIADLPPMPERPPRYDDEVLGVNFFKTEVSHQALENLTIPRTYFGRSLIESVSFRGSDLAESTLCWNDFVNVDFSGASLRSSDLRASVFTKVGFQSTDLTGSDLRRSHFEDCAFDGAVLNGAKLTRSLAAELHLSDLQLSAVDWQQDDGPEPSGG